MYRFSRSYKGLKPLVGIVFILGSLALAQEFDWKAYEGETLNLLLQEHPFQEALVAELPKFTELTGINVTYDIAENYYDDMTLDLARGKSSQYDLFMTDVYHLWQFAPAGWLEKLEPYLNDSSKTSPDYDFEDVLVGLRDSTKWNLEAGLSNLGQGSQYALPFGFETSILIYRKDIFDKYGLNVPTTLDELLEVSKQLKDLDPDHAAIAMPQDSSWEMIHSGFMNLYSGHGCVDFDDSMTPQMNSPCAIEVTKVWLELIKMYESKDQMLEDFNQGKIKMMITDTSLDLGNAIATPIFDGQHTHIGIESLAMNARSKHKDAAWLFMQWATGKDFLSDAAINYKVLNPVRASIWKKPDFQETIKRYPNYLETFNTLITGDMKVQFSPQPLFFETTTQWAQALQDIYAGADIQQRLDELASSITEQLKYARFE